MIRSCLLLLTFACLISVGLSGDLRFPQFVQGGTESGYYVSEIVFINTATTTSSGFIYFRDDNGEPLTIELDNGASGSTFPFNLGPGSSKIIRSTGTGPLKVGWVDVDEVSGAGLGGVLTYTLYQLSGQPLTEVSVEPSAVETSFSLPVEFSQVSNTAVALSSLEPRGVSIPVAFLLVDSNGAIIATSRILEFGGQHHLARFVDQLFPTITPPFRGMLVIAAAGAEPLPGISVVGLKLRDGLFSSIPATPGFFHLFPFMAESENDSRTAPQVMGSLPFAVRGEGGVGDRDYYRVTLDQDDVLVARIEAPRYLDHPPLAICRPEVRVEDADGALLSKYLTQAPELSYWRQTIVFRAPKSGTYYLNIGDANDGCPGGSYVLTAIRVK